MRFASVLMLASVLCALPAQAGTSADASATLATMAWTVGGVWVAQGSGGLDRIETTYSWADTHAMIRFTTKFVVSGKRQNRYDGNAYYDPTTHGLRMWYVHDDYSISQGPLVVTPSGFSLSLTEPDDSGALTDYRVDAVRSGADAYSWTLSQKSSKGWVKILALTFHRLDAAPA